METIDEMQAGWDKAIAGAGAMTESQMREAVVPWPKSEEELVSYIKSLVDRPHDYGTCVYAMSMAAVAVYYYVSHCLGVTGFQASCADLDILRRTRKLERGFAVLDYSRLLYPQYCDSEHFPSWETLIDKNKAMLSKEAKRLLQGDSHVHPEVKEHWERLAALCQE